MQLVRMWLLIGLLGAMPALAADAPPTPGVKTQLHRTACSLGESLASKLGSQKMTPEAAKSTCQQLAPDMNDADRGEFMRCCTTRLQP